MGYEVKLFAVESVNEESDGYSSVVAEIDLCKIGDGHLYALMLANTPKKPRAYVYGLDGNRRFKKDRYGAAMPIMKVADVIKAIEQDNKKEPYRRFEMALAMLKVFKDSFGDRARVLAFGH